MQVNALYELMWYINEINYNKYNINIIILLFVCICICGKISNKIHTNFVSKLTLANNLEFLHSFIF